MLLTMPRVEHSTPCTVDTLDAPEVVGAAGFRYVVHLFHIEVAALAELFCSVQVREPECPDGLTVVNAR